MHVPPVSASARLGRSWDALRTCDLPRMSTLCSFFEPIAGTGGRSARSKPLSCATKTGPADAVETLDSILQVILAVIVILLVLMHSGKDSGLSGAFGVGSGTGPLGGGSMVERNLNRWTIFFAVLFILNAIVLLKQPWS